MANALPDSIELPKRMNKADAYRRALDELELLLARCDAERKSAGGDTPDLFGLMLCFSGGVDVLATTFGKEPEDVRADLSAYIDWKDAR